jgi:hypothetical protein
MQAGGKNVWLSVFFPRMSGGNAQMICEYILNLPRTSGGDAQMICEYIFNLPRTSGGNPLVAKKTQKSAIKKNVAERILQRFFVPYFMFNKSQPNGGQGLIQISNNVIRLL